MRWRFNPYLLLLLCFHSLAWAQSGKQADIDYLCSDKLAGRGYVNGGLEKAAQYIASEFKKAGLQPVANSWYQNFSMPVNTFPSKMKVLVDKKELKPGTEYLVKASSPSLKGEFPVYHVSLKNLETDSAYQVLQRMNWKQTVLVIDTMTYEDEDIDKRYKRLIHNQLNAKAIVIKSKRRLIWTVATAQAAYLTLECDPAFVQSSNQRIYFDIKADFKPKYPAKNVWGMVPGTRYPDSFLVISAHYDHLGKMGSKTIFPGANDNASGTAMMLELARYYGANPQPFSVLFLAFTAEEAGLIGSHYYTLNPAFPLSNIRFLMNLDLEGTGKDGITAVNATLFEEDFQKLVSINDSGKYLSKILPRGEAANSDHYWFSKNGVPCFFIYQMGEYGHYHDPGDRPEKLPLDAFQPTQELIIRFFSSLQGE